MQSTKPRTKLFRNLAETRSSRCFGLRTAKLGPSYARTELQALEVRLNQTIADLEAEREAHTQTRSCWEEERASLDERQKMLDDQRKSMESQRPEHAKIMQMRSVLYPALVQAAVDPRARGRSNMVKRLVQKPKALGHIFPTATRRFSPSVVLVYHDVFAGMVEPEHRIHDVSCLCFFAFLRVCGSHVKIACICSDG